MIRRALAAIGAICAPGAALAHASEQGFVLLLPTDVYIAAGALCVALTLVLIAVLPARSAQAVFAPAPLARIPTIGLHHYGSLMVTGALAWLIWTGLTGSRDPSQNLMSLSVWTLWWVMLVSLQGVLGNLWR